MIGFVSNSYGMRQIPDFSSEDFNDTFDFLHVKGINGSTVTIQMISGVTFDVVERALNAAPDRSFFYSSYIPSVFQTRESDVKAFQIEKSLSSDGMEYVALPQINGCLYAHNFYTHPQLDLSPK